jgi:hypothetical protein
MWCACLFSICTCPFLYVSMRVYVCMCACVYLCMYVCIVYLCICVYVSVYEVWTCVVCVGIAVLHLVNISLYFIYFSLFSSSICIARHLLSLYRCRSASPCTTGWALSHGCPMQTVLWLEAQGSWFSRPLDNRTPKASHSHALTRLLVHSPVHPHARHTSV